MVNESRFVRRASRLTSEGLIMLFPTFLSSREKINFNLLRDGVLFSIFQGIIRAESSNIPMAFRRLIKTGILKLF